VHRNTREASYGRGPSTATTIVNEKDRTDPNQLSTIEQLYSTIDNSNDSDRHGSDPMKYGPSYSTSYDNYTVEKQRTKLDELLSEESAAKDIQQEG
jgi:hypothetical protein